MTTRFGHLSTTFELMVPFLTAAKVGVEHVVDLG